MFHCCNNPDFEKMVNQKAGINMPVTYYWVFQELYRMNTVKMDQEVIQEIRRRWAPMVSFLHNTGTLAESFMDENGVGSSEACHNYGSLPAYFLSSYVLGVRADGPVWEKRLLIEPHLANLTFAEGIVVTEFGPVTVSWKRSSDGKSLDYKISIPKGIHTNIHLPKFSKKVNLTMNGKDIIKDGLSEKGVKIEGRWIIIQEVTGDISGKMN